MQPEQHGHLSPDERRLVLSATNSLIREFEGLLSPDTVAECVDDSLALLAATATVTSYLPLLAERFARDRLRAIARIGERGTAPTTRVLFVCSHNAGRSQIAAGWLLSIAGDTVVASSAGAVPMSAIPAEVIDAMAEVDVDISEEFPKPLTHEIVRAADVVVTLGCGDVCAVLPGQRYEDWQLDDPADRDLAGVRLIRDDIRTRVEALAASLGTVV